ncbi:hypothetical protein KM043_000322 [Ampulex compressa]|nr:hypothetical protein KM043_000322 [Ampulex compressa]
MAEDLNNFAIESPTLLCRLGPDTWPLLGQSRVNGTDGAPKLLEALSPTSNAPFLPKTPKTNLILLSSLARTYVVNSNFNLILRPTYPPSRQYDGSAKFPKSAKDQGGERVVGSDGGASKGGSCLGFLDR